MRRQVAGLALFWGLLGVVSPGALAQPNEAPDPPAVVVPDEEEIKQLLEREPFSLTTWPTWRERLLAWIDDPAPSTFPAFDAARAWIVPLIDAEDQFPPELNRDFFAWYLAGHQRANESLMSRENPQAGPTAERWLRKSIEIESNFARAHRSLAMALMAQNKLNDAGHELLTVKRLDPQFDLGGLDADLAMQRNQPTQAVGLYQMSLARAKPPLDQYFAVKLGYALLSSSNHPQRAKQISRFVEQFPDNGIFQCQLGVCRAMEDDPREAVACFQRARSLGIEPREIINPEVIDQIEQAGAPPWYETVGIFLLWVAVFYLVIMFLMALVGVILARFTRGNEEQLALRAGEPELVAQGQVVCVPQETWLARCYGLALCGGLVLFYTLIPFILTGLAVGTTAILYGIISMGQIPVKLFVLILCLGLAMIWAVLKSLFSSTGSGSFGVVKSRDEIPLIYGVSDEVARRVDTDPVDEIYLAPGAAVGVHQEGRGPFGIFGVSSRVLTLGMATLRDLNVTELQAILAHEYGHFSHQDTYYNRFIGQVRLSIDNALAGMGGVTWINFFNPCFWILYLYQRCFNLLAAGYSRSREFLADRMACSLYGSDVFATALKKVATEGKLFESTIYHNVAQLLESNQSFINMYEAFEDFRTQQFPPEERAKLEAEVMSEQGSLFDSHPTFLERIAAIRHWPVARSSDPRPARDLLANPEEIEKELTEFLTAVLMMQRAQALAAAQAEA